MSTQTQQMRLRGPIPLLAALPAIAGAIQPAIGAISSMFGAAAGVRGGSRGVELKDVSTGLVLGRISRRRALRVLQKRPIRYHRRTIVLGPGQQVVKS